jgi:hypothetical protein
MKFVSDVQHQPFGSTDFKHATINLNFVPFILTFMNKISLHISPRIGNFVQFPHDLPWSTLKIHNPTQQHQSKDMDFKIYSSITCIPPNATTYGQLQTHNFMHLNISPISLLEEFCQTFSRKPAISSFLTWFLAHIPECCNLHSDTTL